MNVLDIKMIDQQQIALEWESSASNDMIADSALALILGVDTSPASIKCKSIGLSLPNFPLSMCSSNLSVMST
jgi:cleavage and polyadenylation specificity factor subunit 3